jgi:hypothetical protein
LEKEWDRHAEEGREGRNGGREGAIHTHLKWVIAFRKKIN